MTAEITMRPFSPVLAALEYATTPLALASLVVIAGIGILKLLVKGRNNALNRMITQYGFITAIIFGLLGNAGYLFSAYQASEFLIFGNVTSSSGRPLSGVRVDAGGYARGLTSDAGDFVLAIPASRAGEGYEVTASLLGHTTATKPVSGSGRAFVRFVLEEYRPSAADVLKLGDAEVTIGHYLGLPEVSVQIRTENPGASNILLTNFSVTLESPSGRVRPLIHLFSSGSQMMPLGPPLPQIDLAPGQTFTLFSVFSVQDSQMQDLSVRAFRALQSNPDFQQTGPKVGAPYLPAPLVTEIQGALAQNWFWEPGETKVRLRCNVAGSQFTLDRRITLTEAQIAAMRRSGDYYVSGYGIQYGAHLTPVGNAQAGLRTVAGP